MTRYRKLPLNITGNPFTRPTGFIGARGTDSGTASARRTGVDEERRAVWHDNQRGATAAGVDVVQVERSGRPRRENHGLRICPNSG